MSPSSRTTCIAAITCLAGAVSADEVALDRIVHRNQAPVDYLVTVNDTDAPGYFRFTVTVDNTSNPLIADIVAVYIEFDRPDFNAADWYSDLPGVDFIQQSDAALRHIMFNTDDVGSGNISGDHRLFDLFDVGIATGLFNGTDFGRDDYQTITFDMAIKAGLTLDDIIGVGIRGNSVGVPDGSRDDNAKEFAMLPCRPDFNVDGFLNTLDVLAFLNAWNAMDPRADYDNDGDINTLDVLAYLNDWADDGCRP